VGVDIRYIRSARLGDIIDVTAEIDEVKNASLTFRHGVYKDGVLLAEALVKLACTDREGKPRRLPDALSHI
jgi:acyl-CoA thioesterase FadM